MIKGFFDEYRWLSNFWYTDVYLHPFTWGLTSKGRLLPFTAKTNEHAYQALKAMFHDDFSRVLNSDTPGQTKRLARTIIMHPEFERIKVISRRAN